MTLTPEEREYKEQQIRNLQSDLFTMVDEAADYHCLKFMDVVLSSDKFWELFGNLDLPYTRSELGIILAKRQQKRQQIIDLRRQLEE